MAIRGLNTLRQPGHSEEREGDGPLGLNSSCVSDCVAFKVTVLRVIYKVGSV